MIAAVHDQVAAGLDAISDGEQTRLDFNLGFYGFLEGIEQGSSPRLLGPPAHDQRPRHRIVGELVGPGGLGTVAEYERLRRVAPPGPTLKVAVPGPYTLAGRLEWRPLGDRRSAPPDRPGGARRARRRRLQGDRDRRAVDELLRAPRGSGTARRRSSTAR